MDNVTSFFCGVFSFRFQKNHTYDSLSKKDDNYGEEGIKNFIHLSGKISNEVKNQYGFITQESANALAKKHFQCFQKYIFTENMEREVLPQIKKNVQKSYSLGRGYLSQLKKLKYENQKIKSRISNEIKTTHSLGL